MRMRSSVPWFVVSMSLAGCFSEAEIADSGGSTTACVSPGCDTGSDGTRGEAETSGDATGVSTTDPQTSSTTEEGTSTTEAEDTSADESTGPGAYCGDGEVNQPNEMCDSTPGCEDDCTFTDYACNPLNNAGCMGGLRCGVADAELETVTCMPPGDGALGDSCSGVPSNDAGCGDGLTCLSNFGTNYCDSGNCCVELCDLTNPEFRCSNDASCAQFWPNPMYVGLGHLGFCRRNL